MIKPYPDIDESERGKYEKANVRWLKEQSDLLSALNHEMRKREIAESNRAPIIELLARQQAERKIQAQVGDRIILRSHAEQVAELAGFQEEVAHLSKRLNFLKQNIVLYSSLRRSYQEVAGRAILDARPGVPATWEKFRFDLDASLGFLAEVASFAKAEFEGHPPKSGRSIEDWRNECFTELFVLICEVFKQKKMQRVQLALDLWSEVFPDKAFSDVNQANRAINQRLPKVNSEVKESKEN